MPELHLGYQELSYEEKLGTVLHDKTPADAAQWVEDNVVDLSSAKNALKIMARLLVALYHTQEG